MDNLFNNINLQNLQDLQNSPMVYGLLAVFLSLYGPRLHPKLPSSVRDLFNNNYFRFAIILLITYLSTRNLQAALVITISFCLILSFTNSQEVEAEIEEQFKENFSNFDTIREFYEDDDEPFFNNALKTAEEAREDFNSPQSIIDGAQQKMTDVIPQRKDKFNDNEDFDNYEHFEKKSESSDTDPKVPLVCKNNKSSKECLELCYKSDGNRNEWCEKVYPNPEKTLMLSKDCEKKKTASTSSTETKTTTKEKTTEEKEDFLNLSSLGNLDNLTKNIVEQVKKYKNLIV